MAKLVRLVYTSHARFEHSQAPREIEPEVLGILVQSRANNQHLKIGGVLYFADGYFFQCLEGNEADVLELVTKIQQDERHENLKVSYCRKVRRRRFKDWSMKYVPVGSEVTEFIQQRGYKSFTPCEFDESDINGLTDLFTRLKDTSLEQEKLRKSYKLKLHWWQRLWRPFELQRY